MKILSTRAAISFALVVGLCAAAILSGLAPSDAHSLLYIAPAVAPAAAVTEEMLGEIREGIKKVTETTSNFASDVQKQLKSQGDLSEKNKEVADKLLAQFAELNARALDLEQKMERRAAGPIEFKSIGHQVIENEDVKKLLTNRRGRAVVNFKNLGLSAAITSAAASAGDLVVEQRVPGIIMPPERRLTIRDLLPVGRTSSNLIEFVRELVLTNNAAAVAENTTKGESDITFEDATSAVRTIAHWLAAAKQILDDAPQLQSYIDTRMRYMLKLVEEDELLNGAGTGQHLSGLITNATAFQDGLINPWPAHRSRIDVLRVAILQVALSEFAASGIVINPRDWAAIELVKDTTGGYVWANPANRLSPTLWGLPVVATQAMTNNSFLVGAFNLAAQIFDREDANVLISTEDSDNIRKNMVTIRCEERLALVIYRALGLVSGDFSEVSN